MDQDSPLACLLIGQPTLRRTMKLAVLAALEQRTALRYTMPGMTPAETASYLTHHLKLAGRPDQLFTKVIFGSNKLSLHFRRSELSRTRPRRWLEGACERLVALLGGLAVFAAGRRSAARWLLRCGRR